MKIFNKIKKCFSLINKNGKVSQSALMGASVGCLAIGVCLNLYNGYNSSPVYNLEKRAIYEAQNLSVNNFANHINSPEEMAMLNMAQSARANLIGGGSKEEITMASAKKVNGARSSSEILAEEGQNFDSARYAMESAEQDRLNALGDYDENGNPINGVASQNKDYAENENNVRNASANQNNIDTNKVNSANGASNANSGNSAKNVRSALRSSKGIGYAGDLGSGSAISAGTFGNNLRATKNKQENSFKAGRAGAIGGQNVARASGRGTSDQGGRYANVNEELNHALHYSNHAKETAIKGGSKELVAQSVSNAFQGGEEAPVAQIDGDGVVQAPTPTMQHNMDNKLNNMNKKFDQHESNRITRGQIWAQIIASIFTTLGAALSIAALAKGGIWSKIAAGAITAFALYMIWKVTPDIIEYKNNIEAEGLNPAGDLAGFFSVMIALTAVIGLAWVFSSQIKGAIDAIFGKLSTGGKFLLGSLGGAALDTGKQQLQNAAQHDTKGK